MNAPLRRLLLFCCSLAAACALSAAEREPAAPDYSDPQFWYGAPTCDRAADIFYVYPTVSFVALGERGDTLRHTDASLPREREAARSNLRFNREVYAGERFNFFAPYYRQITMQAYARQGDSLRALERVPLEDIRRAFDHYMEHFNAGRPFILLGHSQGASLIVSLLEGMSDEAYALLVAAYASGTLLTPQRAAAHPERLRPAQRADDVGVTVLYNSLSTPALIPEGPAPLCINPVNWRTDSLTAPRAMHLGMVRRNRASGRYETTPACTSVRIERGYLICPDIDPRLCYREQLREMFPEGNLHFMDSWLYAADLQANMILRLEAWRKQNVKR